MKEVLFDIIKDEMKKEIKAEKETEYYNEWVSADSNQYTNSYGLRFPKTKNPSEEVWKDIKSKASAYAQAELIKATFKLNGVRPLNINEELKRCKCEAELTINDENTLDIQYTEDGQVYVEVIY